MHPRLLTIAAPALLLVGLFGDTPATMITQNGRTWHGAITASIPEVFKISDGRRTCSANIPIMGPPRGPDTFAIACSDGRKGIVTTSRTADSVGGGGWLQLTDGTHGTLIFGDGAANF